MPLLQFLASPEPGKLAVVQGRGGPGAEPGRAPLQRPGRSCCPPLPVNRPRLRLPASLVGWAAVAPPLPTCSFKSRRAPPPARLRCLIRASAPAYWLGAASVTARDAPRAVTYPPPRKLRPFILNSALEGKNNFKMAAARTTMGGRGSGPARA